MSSPAAPDTSWATPTRILAASLMWALVLIGIALYFVLGERDMSSPPLVVPVVQIGVGVGVHLLLEAIGYRTAPLSPSLSEEEAANEARTRWQSGMVLRFALCEAVAIASVAAAFVLTEGGYLTYVGGVLVSLVLMLLHVWPGARPVGKVADALERDGRRSGLRETFGVA